MKNLIYLLFVVLFAIHSSAMASYDEYVGKTRPGAPSQKVTLPKTEQDRQLERELRILKEELRIQEKKDDAIVSALVGLAQATSGGLKFKMSSDPYLSNKDIASLATKIDAAFNKRALIYNELVNNLKEEKTGTLAVPYKTQLQANTKELTALLRQYNALVKKEKAAAAQVEVDQAKLDSEVNKIMDDFVDLGATCNSSKEASASGWCKTK